MFKILKSKLLNYDFLIDFPCLLIQARGPSDNDMLMLCGPIGYKTSRNI